MQVATASETLPLSQKLNVALIRAYGEWPHLWDPAEPGYFTHVLRVRAWRKIAACLALPYAVPLLKKRIKSLRGFYRREKSREKRSIASGLGPDEVYKSKWYGYEHFHFMSEKTAFGDPSSPYPSTSITHEPPSRDITHTIEMKHGASKGTKKYVARENTHKSEFEIQASARAGAVHKSNVVLGQYVASELCKYEGTEVARFKQAIYNTITKADLAHAAASTTTSATTPITRRFSV